MIDSTFIEINKIINDIPNAVCSGTQPEFLYHLSCTTTGAGEIVEIGTNVGKSAIALGYGQKIKKGKPIFSVDIYEHPEVKKNLEKAGVTDYVNRLVQPSHQVAKTWDAPIELLWIDGDHSYRGVCADIKNWVPFVIDGGFIAFHDYPGHKHSQEVWKALRQSLFKNPYQFRVISDREAGSIIVFQKLQGRQKPVPVGKRIKNHLYWLYRDLRSAAVFYFPSLAKRFKDARKKNEQDS